MAVDPGDELPDVVRLPLRRPTRAEVVPVDVVALGATVRHDDDQGKACGEGLGIALVGPGAVVVQGPVQEVQHRVPGPSGGVVPVWEQHPNVGVRVK